MNILSAPLHVHYSYEVLFYFGYLKSGKPLRHKIISEIPPQKKSKNKQTWYWDFVFSVDKMLKRSFHYTQLKKIQLKCRKGIPLQSNARLSDTMTSEKTTADFREGMQDNTALLTQNWFIQLLIQSNCCSPNRNLHLPHLKGDTVLFPGEIRAGEPRVSQSRSNETKRWEPLWEARLLWTQPYFLYDPAFSASGKMSPKQV